MTTITILDRLALRLDTLRGDLARALERKEEALASGDDRAFEAADTAETYARDQIAAVEKMATVQAAAEQRRKNIAQGAAADARKACNAIGKACTMTEPDVERARFEIGRITAKAIDKTRDRAADVFARYGV